MSVIHTILTPDEIKRLSQKDRDYLKKQIAERTALNKILNRPINQQILHELQCILDKQPLPRQKAGQFIMGQFSRLSDGRKHPCHVRKMTAEERVIYGLEVAP